MNLSKLKLVQRLSLSFAVLVVLLALLLGIALQQIGDLRGGVHELTRNSFPKTVWANDFVDSNNSIARAVRTMLLAKDDSALVGQQRAQLEEAEKVSQDRLDKLSKAITSAEGRQLLQTLVSSDKLFDAAVGEYLRLFDSGQFEQAKVFLLADLRAAQGVNLKNIEALVNFQSTLVEKQGVQAEVNASDTIRLLLIIGGLAVMLACVLAYLLIRSVKRQLGADPLELADITNSIAAGNFDLSLPAAPESSVLAAVKSMLVALQQSAAAAGANARIKSALDNVTANVMIADKNFDIIYANAAVMTMFQSAETDIRTELTGFRASEILGGSIDRFHKNPAHQRGMLERLTSTYKAQIKLGGRVLTVVANPVMSASGERLGAVVEWQDITAQLAIEEKAQRIAAENARVKIALDNVSSNVMIADNDRNIIYMNKTVLTMLQNAESDLRKVLPSFDSNKLLGGSIDQFHKNPEHQKRLLATFTSTYKAQIMVGPRTFALVANPVLTEAGERLGSVVEWADRTIEVGVEQEVAGLVNAAGAGDFTQRIDTDNKEGFFLNLATGLNQLMATSDKGLQDVVRVLGALAEGNLTQRIDAEYQGTFGQLKDFSNETSQSLSNMLGQIRESADTIYTAASEIATGNADLSARTEQQASSLEETASSMEELTSTVKLNADNARQANSLAANASEVAITGGAVVQQVVHTMTAINDSARKISDIIGVIDGIAFQTNILALNAAVEAARAGDQGRGFAVVAAEVRTLAQRSAAAAKEIKTLISDSVDKVDTGNALVAKAGVTMGEIVVAIKRVTDIMSEIAAASSEQSTGIEEVNGAVSQMDEMTQQNAALVEQAAAAAESMQEQASVLSQAVAVFKFDNAGASNSHAPRLSQSHASASGASRAPAPSAARAKPPTKSLPRPSKPKDDEWEEF
ncbi:MAG: MCP four helix bundle domain-containing protein [Pseudomonadaceae bacterium]|nr:MCP four helix bundle domain-containing protein [Pseudomonadaceae bacterium]